VEVSAGEPVTVSVEVRNTGSAAGSRRATLTVNGQIEATRDVSVFGGATQRVSFTLTRDEPGTYTVAVDGLSATFQVVARGVSGWLIVIIVMVVLVIAGGVLYYRARSLAHYRDLSQHQP
jgi:cobalamin biosynthesis Mg chelatase CobN